MEERKLVFNEIKNWEINARVISDTFDIPLSISYRVMKGWQGRESVEQRIGACWPTKYSWSDRWRMGQLVHRGKLNSVENLRHNMIQRGSTAVSNEIIRRELNLKLRQWRERWSAIGRTSTMVSYIILSEVWPDRLTHAWLQRKGLPHIS